MRLIYWTNKQKDSVFQFNSWQLISFLKAQATPLNLKINWYFRETARFFKHSEYKHSRNHIDKRYATLTNVCIHDTYQDEEETSNIFCWANKKIAFIWGSKSCWRIKADRNISVDLFQTPTWSHQEPLNCVAECRSKASRQTFLSFSKD